MLSKPPTFAAPASSVASDPEVQAAYFRNVRSWAQSDADRDRKSRVVAWWIAGASVVGLTAACLGIAALTPLKTVEVTAFRVDNATGAVERVYDVRADKISASDATKRYLVWQYVRLREGFAMAEAASNYESVSLMSAPAVQGQYFDATRGGNPDSPQVRLGLDGTASVKWISTAFLDQAKAEPKLAQVRFVVEETKGGVKQPPRHMVATIAFDFAPGKLKASEININPLGFIVTSYHADLEAGQ